MADEVIHLHTNKSKKFILISSIIKALLLQNNMIKISITLHTMALSRSLEQSTFLH